MVSQVGQGLDDVKFEPAALRVVWGQLTGRTGKPEPNTCRNLKNWVADLTKQHRNNFRYSDTFLKLTRSHAMTMTGVRNRGVPCKAF